MKIDFLICLDYSLTIYFSEYSGGGPFNHYKKRKSASKFLDENLQIKYNFPIKLNGMLYVKKHKMQKHGNL